MQDGGAVGGGHVWCEVRAAALTKASLGSFDNEKLLRVCALVLTHRSPCSCATESATDPPFVDPVG